MKYMYYTSYAAAVVAAQGLESQGYQTAVLISGEIRYWK